MMKEAFLPKQGKCAYNQRSPFCVHFHKEEVLFVSYVFHSIKRYLSFCFYALQEQVLRWMKPSTTSLVLSTLADLTRSKGELLAENALLRVPLIVLRRQVKRPVYRKTDRFLLVRAAPGWSEPGNRRCSSSNRRHSCEGRVNSSVGSGSANRRCLQESRGFRPRRSACSKRWWRTIGSGEQSGSVASCSNWISG